MDEKLLISVLKQLENLFISVNDGNNIANLDFYFRKIRVDLTSQNFNNFEDIKREINGLYGGMGSFSDIVLYKNGVLLIEENNKLHQLKSELFKIVNDLER